MNQNRSNNIFNIKSILHRIFQTPLKFYLRHHLCLRSYFETRPLPNPFYLPYTIKIITEIPNSRSTTVSIFFLQTRPFPNPFDDLFPRINQTFYILFSSPAISITKYPTLRNGIDLEVLQTPYGILYTARPSQEAGWTRIWQGDGPLRYA